MLNSIIVEMKTDVHGILKDVGSHATVYSIIVFITVLFILTTANVTEAIANFMKLILAAILVYLVAKYHHLHYEDTKTQSKINSKPKAKGTKPRKKKSKRRTSRKKTKKKT